MSLSEHGPALLGSLITKLEQLYTAHASRGDPMVQMVQMIPPIILKAQEVKAQFSQ